LDVSFFLLPLGFLSFKVITMTQLPVWRNLGYVLKKRLEETL